MVAPNNTREVIRGHLILGAGRIDPSLQPDLGTISTLDLPICGKSALEHVLKKIPNMSPVWIQASSSNKDFERFIIKNFHNVVGLSNTSTYKNQGLRISALAGLRAMQGKVHEGAILFADTWIDPISEVDAIATSECPIGMREFYVSAHRTLTNQLIFERGGLEGIVAGYFTVSNIDLLISCLENQVNNDEIGFYAALSAYDELSGQKIELIESENWWDFGHRNSFYESRRHWKLGREFKTLSASVNSRRIKKTSSRTEKIQREIDWYLRIPESLQTFVPHFAGKSGDDAYELEYLEQISVGEALVFAKHDSEYWHSVFEGIRLWFDISKDCDSKSDPEERVYLDSQKSIYIEKVKERVTEFVSQSSSGLLPTELFDEASHLTFNSVEILPLQTAIVEYENLVKTYVLNQVRPYSFIHGDLFFGNMIFDKGKLILVDPRGSFGSMPFGGDRLYDFAKLAHSVLGGYDYLAFDRFILERNQDSFNLTFINQDKEISLTLIEEFTDLCENQEIPMLAVRVLMAGLFLSLAALHVEAPDRQIASFLIGLREITLLVQECQ